MECGETKEPKACRQWNGFPERNFIRRDRQPTPQSTRGCTTALCVCVWLVRSAVRHETKGPRRAPMLGRRFPP